MALASLFGGLGLANAKLGAVHGFAGPLGGMFAAPGKDKVLLASTDGVGTKLKVAVMTGRHNTVGQDIVNHCVNDILVHGAEPLFFLDYFGTARFQGRIFKAVMAGTDLVCRPLAAAGATPDALVRLTLGAVPACTDTSAPIADTGAAPPVVPPRG